MKKKNNFRLVLTTAMMVALFGSQSLQAQIPVTDVAANTQLVTANTNLVTLNTSVNSQLGTTNTTLNTLNQYLQTGNTGNGLIPLLSAINEKLGKSNSNDQQAESNANMAQRDLVYEQEMLKMKMGATPTQSEFLRACVEITSRTTTAQGHGAARGAADAYRQQRELATENEQYLTTPETEAAKVAARVINRGSSGYCSSQDIKNGSPGCTNGSVGSMPNADLRASSLTQGATGATTDPTNSSLTVAQADAARAYIRNILPSAPTMPSPKYLETNKGKLFQASLNRYVARISAGRDGLNAILASHEAIGVTANGNSETSGMLTDWRNKEAMWGRVFGPQLKFPQNPSERDLLRLEVFQVFADPKYKTDISTRISSTERGAAEAAKEQIRLMGIQNRIMLQMLERQEQSNVMLAAIMANQLDPVTKQSLDAASAATAQQ